MAKRPRKSTRKGAKRGPKEERLVIPPDKLEDAITAMLTKPKPRKAGKP